MVKVKMGEEYPKDIEEMDNEDIKVNRTYWEHLCGSCDNFGTDECPFLGKVGETNNWKEEIRCNRYDN